MMFPTTNNTHSIRSHHEGTAYVSRTECMVNEVREATKLPCMEDQDACTSAEIEHWIPIFSW